MLAAIERDHLTGQRRGADDEAHRGRDLLRAGAAPERHLPALALELLRRLPWAREGRAGADAGDANSRREGEGHALRQGPEPDLRDSVGDEIGRDAPDPLV